MNEEEFYKLVARWNDAKTALESAKQQESDLREAIISEKFKDSELGTTNLDLGHGYKLKAVIKQTISLDKKEDVEAMLIKLDENVRSRLFKYEWKMSEGEYKKLEDKDRLIVDTVITKKPAKPSLELVAPKEG